jgi:hypothetical protein
MKLEAGGMSRGIVLKALLHFTLRKVYKYKFYTTAMCQGKYREKKRSRYAKSHHYPTITYLASSIDMHLSMRSIVPLVEILASRATTKNHIQMISHMLNQNDNIVIYSRFSLLFSMSFLTNALTLYPALG